LAIRIQTNPGQIARLVHAYVVGPASAGATLIGNVLDEDAAASAITVNVAAGVARSANLPSIGTAAAASANLTNTLGLMIGPGEYLSFNASTSLLNETLTLSIVLLLNTPDIPLWDITGSVGGSALGDSTISDANTLQKVDLPW